MSAETSSPQAAQGVCAGPVKCPIENCCVPAALQRVYPNCRCELCNDCESEGRGLVRMALKGSVEASDFERRGGTDLYQCPKCKNVEVA